MPNVYLSIKEIRALLVATDELNEKMGFVVEDYYDMFGYGLNSNEEITEGLISFEEKIRSKLSDKK